MTDDPIAHHAPAHTARSRIQNYVDIEDEDYAERAQELIDLLFPTGLDFLNLPYPEQWAESQRRIALIEQDQLDGELTELVNERFMKNLYEAHEAYGKALGITEKKNEEQPVLRVDEALRALRAEMAGYARLVLGLIDESDPKEVAAAEAQLEPILRFRRRNAADGEAPEEEPVDAPLPDLPAAVEAPEVEGGS